MSEASSIRALARSEALDVSMAENKKPPREARSGMTQ
jgi:hypothetical protein